MKNEKGHKKSTKILLLLILIFICVGSFIVCFAKAYHNNVNLATLGGIMIIIAIILSFSLISNHPL